MSWLVFVAFVIGGDVLASGIAIGTPKQHGGQVVMDVLQRELTQLGARIARPGEFSERAFLNDKLDLAQAESIADLIDASSEQAARNALRSLQGCIFKPY